MFFYLLAIIILCCVGIRFADSGELHASYLDKDSTTPVKGVYILLIFASHCAQYVDYNGVFDAGYLAFRKWSGQTVVAMFLFYSGYGILTSIRRKGLPYVRALPGKRILRILVHYWIALLFFLAVNFIIRKPYAPKTTLLSFTTWTSIGNSNWYILAILLCYLVTFAGFFLFRNKELPALLLTTTLIAGSIVLLHRVRPEEGRYYNTLLCYAAGLWYGFLKTRIDASLLRRKWLYPAALSALAAGTFAIRPYVGRLRWYLVWTVLYALMILFLTMKVRIGNRVLNWAGDHLFELFIIQRVPMRLFSVVPALTSRPYLFTLLSLAATVPLTLLLSGINRQVDRIVFRIPAADKGRAVLKAEG